MSGLHREKTETSTQEDSRRLGKTPPERWGPPAIGQGQALHLSGVATQGLWPIVSVLTNLAFTDFED